MTPADETPSGAGPRAAGESGGGTDTLPVLDLGRFRAGDPSDRAAFLADLRHAAHDVGFFYLIGHGVDPALVSQVFETSRAFFALPEADRLSIENVNSPHFRGYTRVGNELTGGTADWRDQLDVGAERPPLDLGPDDPPWYRLQGPNQWPAALPELRTTLLTWMDELTAVAEELLRALAVMLGQDEEYFAELFGDDPNLRLKVVRYPGRPRRPGRADGGGAQGVGAHKDYGFLTLLLQDDSGGLQVADGHGGWLDAPPRSGTFVVNLGEMLEVATAGRIVSTVHRVVSPDPTVERISLPFFFNPRLQAVVRPVPGSGDDGVTADPGNPIFAQYGRNELKGWLRAHPAVARRYYGDLPPDW